MTIVVAVVAFDHWNNIQSVVLGCKLLIKEETTTAIKFSSVYLKTLEKIKLLHYLFSLFTQDVI